METRFHYHSIKGAIWEIRDLGVLIGESFTLRSSLLFQSQASLGLLSCVKTVWFPLMRMQCVPSTERAQGTDLLSCCLTVAASWT